MTDFSRLVPGESTRDIELATARENAEASHALISRARRSIEIYTHELDPRVYDRPACIAALKAFVLHHPSARVRILIRNPHRPLKTGHRLLGLARQLSSYIGMRVIPEDYKTLTDAFLIVDRRGILHLPEADRYEGRCRFNHPRQARDLHRRFTEVWHHSTEVADFRRLYI